MERVEHGKRNATEWKKKSLKSCSVKSDMKKRMVLVISAVNLSPKVGGLVWLIFLPLFVCFICLFFHFWFVFFLLVAIEK